MQRHCCADCGEEGGASLKACKSCMLVKYCNAKCQRNHWPQHKKECKQHAAELRDKALFKDPPAKEDCPICFLPMPMKLITCHSLSPATILSVPIYDFATANEGLAAAQMHYYFSCCGKSICKGCGWSFTQSGYAKNCPFCKAENEKTDEKRIEQLMKRVAANDAVAMHMLGNHYRAAERGLMQDQERAMELFTKSAELGFIQAHCNLGNIYHEGGDLKKAKFHFEAAAMAGHEVARYNLGISEFYTGKKERALKHWKIGASAGEYHSMHILQMIYEVGGLSRYEIDSILTAYNDSCAEMRSRKRDYFIETHDALCAELGVPTRV